MIARHYSYRVDHDLGFAPHVDRRLCTVCGCKTTTVERWVSRGSWVVGIGGATTGKPNTLLYAMKVDTTPSYTAFRRSNPRQAAYLAAHAIPPDAPVLVARLFYYFGDQARPLPKRLAHIIHLTQGCKRLSNEDVGLLEAYLRDRFQPGKHGSPNNGKPETVCQPAKRLPRTAMDRVPRHIARCSAAELRR